MELELDLDNLEPTEDSKLYDFCVNCYNQAIENSVNYSDIDNDLARFTKALYDIWYPNNDVELTEEMITIIIKMYNAITDELLYYQPNSFSSMIRVLYTKLSPSDITFIRQRKFEIN